MPYGPKLVELQEWMDANEEARHKARDENKDLLAELSAYIIFSEGNPEIIVNCMKMALYAGYKSGIVGKLPEVPKGFLDAFKDEKPNEGGA